MLSNGSNRPNIILDSAVDFALIEKQRLELSTASAERKERGNILIAISEHNEVWIDRRKIDIRAVRANVERMHASNPEGAVIIQADKSSKNGILVQVIDQIRLAGVSNVAIAAKPE